MSKIFVNQAGSVNGWDVGDNSNDGSDEQNAYLTWDYLHDNHSLQDGDIIVFNSNRSTEYDCPNTAKGNKLKVVDTEVRAQYFSNQYSFDLFKYSVGGDYWFGSNSFANQTNRDSIRS